MADPPRRSPSQEFQALGLRSQFVDELLSEIHNHVSDVTNERLRLLPDEVKAIVSSAFFDRARSGADTTVDEIERVTDMVHARFVAAIHSAERADLAARAVRLRVSKPVMLFATRYYNAGINSTAGPGRHDTPTPLLPPAPVEPKDPKR